MIIISTKRRLIRRVGCLFGGLCFLVLPLHADWKNEIGFTRLQLLAGSELPSAPARGFSQIEASPTGTTDYAPNIAAANFSGKGFTLKSGASSISPHANTVALRFYGNPDSLISGNAPVDLYAANDWKGSRFLNAGTFSAPLIEFRAVQNHSWIGGASSSGGADINQRLDYAIDRDGFVCVVGENNGNSTELPELLGQGYHTISVGLVNGGHSAGFTTLDTTGRIKPDIVAPDTYTSYAAPMVSSAAGLLYAKLVAAPYSPTGADLPRVIKALLMASATKNTVASWAKTDSRPLDLRYGAGELNINHAYNDLRAGPSSSSPSTLQGPRGWGAESVSGNATSSYFLTIPAGAPTPFCAALTWHRVINTKINWLSQWSITGTSLANLDLRLYHADGFSKGDLIEASLSTVDNVEMIYQPTLAPGTYLLEVTNNSTTATPFALAWHSLPSVSIVASDPAARELDLHPATLTITRTGDTTLPLFVPIFFSGSATVGVDFIAPPASVTIPAGQSSTTLEITPIADDQAEGDRTVNFAIAADFALVRNPLQVATITIEDKPFDAWRFANFSASELANPTISGPMADPDGDQLTNLVEYALNLDPKHANPSPIIASEDEGHLAISAVKNPSASDITWQAEVSDDLQNWSSADIITSSPSDFKARDPLLMESSNKRFIRLRITHP